VTTRILVVCEAPADFRIASDLADRVVCETVEWIDEALLPDLRTWQTTGPGRPFVLWTELDRIARSHGLRLRPRSRFAGELGAADAAAADKALQLAVFLPKAERPDAVLLIRDSDDQGDRDRGIRQASAREPGHSWPFAVAIGLAHPKREAWVLAGYEPQSADETARLNELRTELGHDPCAHSHRITARTPGSKRDIKRVLMHLTREDIEREPPCWQSTPLDLLRTRGHANGLAAYLADIETHIVPLLGGP
jgi:hypothetical protein